MLKKSMTSDQYKRALETLGLTQRAAGDLLGFSHRTSAGYALGEHPIPQSVAKLLQIYLSNATIRTR